MPFKDKLDKLAEHLADKAIQGTTPYAESIDAFKELRAYYATIMKETKPEEPNDNKSFGDFQRKVQQASEHNNGKVRSRRADS